ncbi:MAG: hypothetical protein AB7T27_01745 [Kiritimatiellia bacterium]
MGATDFFDDDLVKPARSQGSISMGPGAGSTKPVEPGAPSTTFPARPVSDFNLTRMAKHREEVESQVARAAQELEHLRQRQEDLEREKHDLEDLRRMQDDYQKGKREMMEQLSQSLLTLEKDELRAEQTRDLLAATRRNFKTMLDSIRSLNDESWGDEMFREELGKARVTVEDARMEYNKARAKIDALLSIDEKAERGRPLMFETPVREEQEFSFGHWFKVGLAVSLPLTLVIIILGVVFAVLKYLRFI